MLPHKINIHSTLIKDALLTTEKTWIGHERCHLNFLEQINLDVHHRNRQIITQRFYNIKCTTSPQILISYVANDKFSIL